MIHVGEVLAGVSFVSTFVVSMSAVLLLQAPREGDRNAAWLWAAVFAASSLVADCCLWELSGGGA